MTNSAAVLDRNISKFDDNKRGLAKLMAKENISVQILDGIGTAWFNVVTRVLTLPNWPFSNVNTLDLLIGHEIGHALYTDSTFIEKQVERREQKHKDGKRIHTYWNVVEDSRIERKIRDAYPGMKAVFYHGYGDFAKNGPILQVSDRKHVMLRKTRVKVGSLPFIDRINLHYKIGAFVDVPFTPAEAAWLPRIDRCYSTENAWELAVALYEYAREQAREQASQPSDGKGEKSEKSDKKSKDGGKGESEKSDKKSKDDKAEKSKDKKSKSKDGDEDEQDTNENGDESDGEESNGGGDSSDDSDDAGSGGEGSEEGDDDSDSDGDGDEGDDSGARGSASGDSDDEGGDSDDEGDEEGDGEPSGQPASNRRGDGDNAEPEESQTDKAIREGLQQLVEEQARVANSIKHVLLAPLSADTVKRHTVTIDTWMKENASTLVNHELDLVIAEQQWNSKFLGTAKHMAAEFLRRRTAKNLQHARVGRTGRLDVNRLHSYKFADDLFKRVTIVPNGQSHGIVMLIDGSSSMSTVFPDVLDQVLLFGLFTFTAGIPFEAYMFTDEHVPDTNAIPVENNSVTMPTNCAVLQLMNTATNRRGFRQQMRFVLALQSVYRPIVTGMDKRRVPVTKAGLGNTPLYGGMMLMERHVERMKRILRLDKVMGVVISDGGDNAGLHMRTQTVNQYGKVVDTNQAVTDRGAEGFGGVVLRDTVTKQNFICVVKDGRGYKVPPSAFLTMLFDVMKARHDMRGIYMFLVGSDSGASYAASSMLRPGAVDPSATDITRDMAKHAQYVVPNACTDCGIVQSTGALKIEGKSFKEVNTTGLSSDAIGRMFVDHNRNAQKNRVFINTVMPFIA
jgi:hypothetical protein